MDTRHPISSVGQPGHRFDPDFPERIVFFLKKKLLLDADFVVADLGSPSGKSSMLFLPHVKKVFAVVAEVPGNDPIRKILSKQPSYTALDARPEATGLPDASVDLVFAGQALRHFDAERTKAECGRILRQNRPAVLMDCSHDAGASNFMRAYNDFLREYTSPNGGNGPWTRTDNKMLSAFFQNGFETEVFRQETDLDFDGLKNEYLASPSAFGLDHPRHEEALEALRALFDRFEYRGHVVMAHAFYLHVGLFNPKRIALWKKTVFHLLRLPAFFAYLFLITAMFFSSLFRKLRKKLSGG
jgi:hypothetical protein